MGVAASSRTWALGAIALALAATVALRYGGDAGGNARSDEAVRARIETLRRVVASRAAISAQYADVAAAFAERFAEVVTYRTKGKTRPENVVALVRGKLDALGPFQSLSIAPGTLQPTGDGMARLTVNASFTTTSDRQAVAALRLFARPETGLAWQSVTVTADRRDKHVTVSGKLLALLVDPVE